MKRDNVRQFVLVSGDEIVCEVVEWDAEDSEEIVVRNMYKIISIEVSSEGIRYHTFRPFMCMQNDEMMFQTLNPYHIMSTAIPAKSMIDQYETNLSLNKESFEEVKKELDDRIRELKERFGIDDEEEPEIDPDSKVIKFTPKDKLH
jgi:hypothetical protein